MGSSDGLFNSFVHITNDKRAAHTPYALLQTITDIWALTKGSESRVYCSLNKFTIPLPVLADFSTYTLCNVLSYCLFTAPLDGPAFMHVILLCNLIGAAWFQAPEVNNLNLPMLPSSFLPCAIRGNSLGTFLVCVWVGRWAADGVQFTDQHNRSILNWLCIHIRTGKLPLLVDSHS